MNQPDWNAVLFLQTQTVASPAVTTFVSESRFLLKLVSASVRGERETMKNESPHQHLGMAAAMTGDGEVLGGGLEKKKGQELIMFL